MNLDDVRTIVQAVGDREQARPLLLPGSVGQVSGTGLVEVVMDSDPDGTSIEATCLFADVGEGDRVMVLFDPPRGVFVVGLVGRTVEAGQLVAYHREVVVAEPYSTQTTVASYLSPTVQWRAGRYYDLRLSVSVNLDPNDSNPVVVIGRMVVDGAPTVNVNTAFFFSDISIDGALAEIGTLHFSRLMLLSSPFSQSVDAAVTLETPGVGGDVDFVWELAVFDAGPASAVLT